MLINFVGLFIISITYTLIHRDYSCSLCPFLQLNPQYYDRDNVLLQLNMDYPNFTLQQHVHSKDLLRKI